MLRFYQLGPKDSEGGHILAGISPIHIEEALRTGILGTLVAINHQLIITIKFKKHVTA